MTGSLATLTPHPAVVASTPCITIDKGIPIPTPRGRGRRHSGMTLAMKTMDVGDSFIYPADGRKTPPINVAGRQARYVAASTGRKFVCRTVIENGQKVVRVWRFA
jgi:hypothetical protein